MTLQQSLAGDLLWFVVNAVVLFVLFVGFRALIRWVRARRAPEDHCQIGGCKDAAYSVYDRHPSGAIWVCRLHTERIQAQAGPRPDETVYDQDLAPGTDLATWEDEVGS